MTIGEKIKYFRKQSEYSQSVLSELTGIHLITIAKYETNKMHPQPKQIERLAQALQVPCCALEDERIQLFNENPLSLLLLAVKQQQVQLHGTRNKEGYIIPETAHFSLPERFHIFETPAITESHALQLADKQALQDLLAWERLAYTCQLANLTDEELEELQYQRDVAELAFHQRYGCKSNL